MKERLERIQELRRRQPLEELERKRNKARRRGFWTTEDLDHIYVAAEILYRKLNPGREVDE
jgi:cell shape-determining protein MreC